MTTGTKIRVIAFKEDDLWVAQCLEYDIGAQAPDLETLNLRLRLALMLEAKESEKNNGEPFSGIEKAPQHYFDLWDKRAGDFNPKTDGDNAPECELNYALSA